ncbi:MAG TPA: M28 family peptidase [Patescibacteria group bacterium]|nr:M28 family peptidase [Patescibacteria group bacterium]
MAVATVLLFCGATLACSSSRSQAAAAQASPPAPAPPAARTGGFDGSRAWSYLEKIVAFGPRPPASANIIREQHYLAGELRSFGCPVTEDHFHAETQLGTLEMDNIVTKIPGRNPGIVLFLSHYDTLRLPGFVGADDGGSSTALLLEMARVLCGHRRPLTVWIAFLDGEEDQQNFTTAEQAQTTWSNDNSTFGSRELAASMDNSGDLKRVKAVLLADMIGDANLDVTRDTNSTPWLENMAWATAKKLGYGRYFLNTSMGVYDDHMPFVQRHVPAADIIDFDYPYWHTVNDTLDKCSPHSLAVVGYVLLETLHALDRKFAPVASQ